MAETFSPERNFVLCPLCKKNLAHPIQGICKTCAIAGQEAKKDLAKVLRAIGEAQEKNDQKEIERLTALRQKLEDILKPYPKVFGHLNPPKS